MGFWYTIDLERRLIYLRFSGVLDMPTLSTARQAIWADPLFAPTLDAVADVTAVAAHELQWSDLLRLESRPESPGGARLAIVARSSAQVEAARVFTALRSTQDNIFVTPYLDEALRWLGREGWRPPHERL